VIHLPEDFKQKMKMLMQDEYDAFIRSYDCPKYSALRVNTLKVSIDEFKKLSPFKLEPIEWVEEGFYFDTEDFPGKHAFHFAGLFYIQEPSAMAVARVLDAQPGEKILDLCAAPGGKSTQIACAMQGEGLLVSNEIIPSRAAILAENMERFGVKNAVIVNESPDRLAGVLAGFFDKILVDAPCSGEGMFRKEPAACSEWSEEAPLACSKRQLKILNEAVKMLKPGGKLVYSTCTFSPEENEGVIEQFLQSHADFELCDTPYMDSMDHGRPGWVNGREELKKCIRIWPHKQKGEGHFIALLQKKAESVEAPNHIRMKENKEPKANIYYEFEKENLNCKLGNRFVSFGDNLYLVSENLFDCKGLKVIRPGLHLGMVKKNRFEPSHALAMVLKKKDYVRFVDYSSNDSEIIAYLKGEVLNTDVGKGWTGVLVDGFPLGWGKSVDGVLKNHYPKGLRIRA